MAGEPEESDGRSWGPAGQGSEGHGGTELAWPRPGETKAGGLREPPRSGGCTRAGAAPQAPRVSAAPTLREMDGVGEMRRGAPGGSWRSRRPRSGGSGGESGGR